MTDPILHPKVEWGLRPMRDLPCAILFLLTVLAYLTCGIYMIAAKNVSLPTVSSDSNTTFVTVEFSTSLQSDIDECNRRIVLGGGGGRMLQTSTSSTQDKEIWTIFALYPEIPAVIVLFVIAIGVAWLVLLNKFAKPVVWATAFIKTAAIAALGVWMLRLDSTAVAVFCFIGSAVFLVITWVVRDKINLAAKHMQMGIDALKAEPSVFLASGILKTINLVSIAFYCVAVESALLYWEVTHVTGLDGRVIACTVSPVSWSHRMITFISFGMVWITYFVSAAKTHVTAISVACWYFDQKEGDEGRPKYPALSSLPHVFTKSAGTIAIASIVCTIVERILSKARSRFWWTDPLGCCLKLVMVIFQTLIETLTKFTIIVHALYGMNFFNSAKACFSVLKRNFVGAVVTDQVGNSVLKLGAYAFSLAVGFAAWAWTDEKNGWDTLTAGGWGDLGFEFLFYIFLVFYVYLTNYPLPTIFLVSLFSQYMTGQYSAPLVGIFCAAVANILLNYLADVVLNSMDTIFLCFAIGKDNGDVHVEGRGEMYKLLQELPECKVVVAEPAYGAQQAGGVVAYATPAAVPAFAPPQPPKSLTTQL